jgi:hypothetical protein
VIFVALFSFIPFPQDAGSEMLDLRGFVEMDKRFLMSDGVSKGDTYGKLRLEARSDWTSSLFSLVSSDLRFYDFPKRISSSSADKIESDYHLDLLLWEAYMEANQFIWDGLDLKLGKQRIAWGTADQFNPTDNLNRNDFTDLFDFGAKVPTFALRADYYLADYSLTGLWLPYFEPALFSTGGTLSFFGKKPDEVDLPSRNMGNGMYAIKLQGIAFNWDFSFSYFYGYDNIPIEFRDSGSLVVGFPRMRAVGFDFAGETHSVGVWGEAALFFPQEVKSGTTLKLSDEPFFKYTLGADYTFKSGIYLETQYVHGFFTERGRENLHDYLIVGTEKRFLNDELTLSLNCVLEGKDIGNLKENYGIVILPEVIYRPFSNLEFSLGAYVLNGKKGTLVGGWRDLDQAYVKIKIDF